MTKIIKDKKEEVLKMLTEGLINHQFKDEFNQNKLLSFNIIKRRTIQSTVFENLPTINTPISVNFEDDPYAIDEEDDGQLWSLDNDNASIHDTQRISQIFEIYKDFNSFSVNK